MRNMVWGTSYSNQADSFTEFLKEICLWKSSLFPYKSSYIQLHFISPVERTQELLITNENKILNKTLWKVKLCVYFVATGTHHLYPAIASGENPCGQNPHASAFGAATAGTLPRWVCSSTAAPPQHTQGHKAVARTGQPWTAVLCGQRVGWVICLSTGQLVTVFTDFCWDFWSVAKCWLIIELSCVGCSTERGHCMCNCTAVRSWNGTK